MQKLRQFTNLLLALCLVVCMVPCEAFAQEAETSETLTDQQEGNFTYSVTDGKATLTKYTGSERDVVVPAQLGGYPVYSVDSQAFYYNDDLENLTFSEGIVDFYSESILLCQYLKSVHYPSTAFLSSAGSSLLGLSSMPSECYSLETITVAEANPYAVVVDNILYSKDMKTLLKVPEGDTREVLVIPEGVEEIASSACTDNEHIKQVIMPDTVSFIGYWAFDGCRKLEKMNISESCEIIGQYAFNNTSLTTFHFPAVMEMLMPGAFGYMGKDTVITVDVDNPVYFAQDNVLYIRYPDGVFLVRYPAGSKVKEYAVPEGVKGIEFAAFGSEILSVLYLPGSLNFIDETAFVGYSDLTVYYPSGSSIWTEETRAKYPFFVTWQEENGPHRHTYSTEQNVFCITCGKIRTVPMFRMYDPNSGEHFYTGSEEERENLVKVGWNYEGVGFNFPLAGEPVYRLYEPETGEHLYTMDEEERAMLLSLGWNDENVAFNTAGTDEVPQYRLHNPNETRGAYHFTGSEEERDYLISLGWEYQGIGWYSCLQ